MTKLLLKKLNGYAIQNQILIVSNWKDKCLCEFCICYYIKNQNKLCYPNK